MARRLDSVFIATCSDILDESGATIRHNSPAWPLMDYFSRRCARVSVLELSVPRKGMVNRPQLTTFRDGRRTGFRTWGPLATRPFAVSDDAAGPRTFLRLKLRDLAACLWAASAERGGFDLFIGVESLLALCGGYLKKLGKVRESVYYISDWSPWKFSNKALNKVYLEMDRAACLLSDHIWNYTDAIEHARRDILKFDDTHFGRQHRVPFGFIPDGATPPPDHEVDLNRLVFCGGIGPENGLDVIVEALPGMARRLPGIRLDVLGDGPDLPRLKERARELGVDGRVTWHGYVTDRAAILKAQLGAALALAPYAPLEHSVKRFGDVIKIREAIGCGLPVVTTNVPPSHKEVLEKNLGRVIDYSPQALEEAVAELLGDPERYFAVRAGVLAASGDNLWDAVYGRTLAAMGYGGVGIR
ncbi:GDP-mannose-dependent alpha-(1-6)-phosphatidylinositol monomannoside mannosyltransferase [Fundidesulfovibrio magnetotacticus]|uniref:GDP-mannose-dependent alpha-(1-6)-phosphatidylinositol monomannoside mannosyltransferase n=1 Tax=Fundidesulfovibrio magnetotacticus TaxID=2730080 RepID=A0A6V8LS34_9BACT|nr:glycosyltransferase [Fundidesulfovibrio magnetotacticus]GFK92919.1 GDP-mannose-dependent alpha-(1-6)-phosphatidylinositol monomannoside mannosyltransferase [Fundidesulfovibrio magnetotacticus]